LASLLQTAIWLGVLVFDPFGMSTAADRGSEDIYLRLFPLFYPDDNREKIKVVAIRDDELPLPMPEGVAATKSWPLSYEEYAALLRKIVSLEPRGIFVDLFFKPDERRQDLGPLSDFLKELKPGGPTVVFADFDGDARFVRPEIRALPFSGSQALRGLAEFNVPPLHYPIGNGRKALSAAAVLYSAAVPGAKRLAPSDGDFLVAWSNTVRANEALDSNCAPITSDQESRAWAFIGAVVAGIDTKFDSLTNTKEGQRGWSQLQPCPHHEQTRARFVMAMPKEMLAGFKGAYVFVGADIKGSGDSIVSPVHGQIPGVHLHAMAFDNLLTFGGQGPFLPDDLAIPLQAILIFIVAVLGRLFFENRPEADSRLQALRGLGARAGAWLVVAVAILGALLAGGFGPNNWGGVAAIAAALFFSNAFGEIFVLAFGAREKEQADE
jgi:hypothetical protein